MYPGKQEPSGSPSQPDEVEHLPGGVTVEWLVDRQIVCYVAPDAARVTIQALFDHAESILRGWPQGKPHLNILDFSSGRMASTPYTRERGRVILTMRPDLVMATAFVLPPSVQMRIFQLMSRTVSRPNGQMAVFATRDEAIVWLKRVGHIE